MKYDSENPFAGVATGDKSAFYSGVKDLFKDIEGKDGQTADPKVDGGFKIASAFMARPGFVAGTATEHQAHGLSLRWREDDKLDVFVKISEIWWDGSHNVARELSLRKLAHLITNITEDEITQIANREVAEPAPSGPPEESQPSQVQVSKPDAFLDVGAPVAVWTEEENSELKLAIATGDEKMVFDALFDMLGIVLAGICSAPPSAYQFYVAEQVRRSRPMDVAHQMAIKAALAALASASPEQLDASRSILVDAMKKDKRRARFAAISSTIRK